jgi:hypothetical protein
MIQVEEPVKGSWPDAVRSCETRPVPSFAACFASSFWSCGFEAAGVEAESTPLELPAGVGVPVVGVVTGVVSVLLVVVVADVV